MLENNETLEGMQVEDKIAMMFRDYETLEGIRARLLLMFSFASDYDLLSDEVKDDKED